MLAVAGQARADGLDLSALRARVDAALADTAVVAPQRGRYASLARKLARRDRPGLADEFAKLERVAVEVRGALSQDFALAASLDTTLAAGTADALPDDDADVARAAALVESAAPRRRIDGSVRAARKSLADALRAQADARPDLACRAAARAAAHLRTARAAAESAVRRQDARRATWKVVLRDVGGALLGVHVAAGLSPDVYLCGATDGAGPLFLRCGGEAWVRIPVTPIASAADELWWLTEVPGAGIWASGTRGVVVRYDPATGAVSDVSAGVDATLYGLWGTDAATVWTCGVAATGDSVLRRFDGAQWHDETIPAPAQSGGIYKLWGRAADDVFACGVHGVVLHFDGAAWSEVPATATGGAPFGADLLTIHGAGDRVVAVGRVLGAGVLELRANGTFGEAALPASASSASGVFVPAKGDVWAAGYHGNVLRRTRRGWTAVRDVPDAVGSLDLHAVAMDERGGVWIVGGDLVGGGAPGGGGHDEGILLYRGPRTPPSEVVARSGFRSSVQPVLTANCTDVACHAPPFVSEELDLSDAAAARAGLVDAASTQSPLLRVLPGRPSASYLWRKLEGTHLAAGGTGDAMPEGATLGADDLAAVRAWILEGAPGSD